eukprot:1046324-Pyramimonas_sp.AAC.1
MTWWTHATSCAQGAEVRQGPSLNVAKATANVPRSVHVLEISDTQEDVVSLVQEGRAQACALQERGKACAAIPVDARGPPCWFSIGGWGCHIRAECPRGAASSPRGSGRC